MCGIAGILTRDDGVDLSAVLRRMQSALRHRGPDDEGLTEVQAPGGLRIGLVQTRLAILDLSPAGHQPMHDPVSDSWIVYNGEVFNHHDIRESLPVRKFRSTSDTETLLLGWRDRELRIIDSARGMFAFGLYDGLRQRFWLVRDRLGIKPLYVTRLGDETWLFASEVRALLASGLLPSCISPAAVQSYLMLGCVPAPWTIVEGIESVLPGEAWCFDLRTSDAPREPVRYRYWTLPFNADSSNAGPREPIVSQLRETLTEAVRLRMLSDVPVGLFLSGGIDSSALVSFLAGEEFDLRTFNVAFDEDEFDESTYASSVARSFGAVHTEVRLRSGEILDDFDAALDAYDQPSIDGLNTYFISRAVRRKGLKVALSGLGGDELFAGYPYFRLLSQLRFAATRRAGRLLARCVGVSHRSEARFRKLTELLAHPPEAVRDYLTCRQVAFADRRADLLDSGAWSLEDCLPADLRESLTTAVRGLDPVNAQSCLDVSLYLGNMLLRDTDQMSMAHALEVRVPFLDHHVVEAVARIPGALKLAPGRDGKTKGLLLDSLPRPLPHETVRRRKMGFVLPWEKWLRGRLRPRVGEILHDAPALAAAGLRPESVAFLWQAFLDAKSGIRSSDVLALVCLARWSRRHLPARSLSPVAGLTVASSV